MLYIDEELRSITPPLKEYEYRILEADILARGCITPILVWDGTIIDGHTRYEICRKHDVPFTIEGISFHDKTEAKCWIITNQLGRRNLSPFSRCELVLRYEGELKEQANRIRREKISKFRITGVMSPSATDTHTLLANMAGVSTGNLHKAKYILAYGDEETKWRLRNDEITIHFAYTTLRGSDPRKAAADILRDVKSLVNALTEDIESGKADLDDTLDVLSTIRKIMERGN